MLFAKTVLVTSALSFFVIERPGIRLGRVLALRLFGSRPKPAPAVDLAAAGAAVSAATPQP